MGNQTSDHNVLLNQLILEALDCSERQELACFFANNTNRIVGYDQATLWDIELYKPRLLANSAMGCQTDNLEVSEATSDLVSHIDDKENIQTIEQTEKTLLWVPIPIDQRTTLGLLFEREAGKNWSDDEKKTLTTLAHAYGHAWKGSYPQWTLSVLQKIRWIVTGLVCLILLSIIPVPSRIYAPCEIVAEKQQPVNAPFDGVIKNIAVDTGDTVAAGQLLFSYDKDTLMQELKTTRENFENADTEPLRQKEQKHLQLLQDRLEELNVKATIEGTANVHGKGEWQGRKVLAGEHVLSISDPKDTKIRISLPEGKEIVISPDRPIYVYFDEDSERTYKARIIHVNADQLAFENSTLSFTAEAIWKKTPKDLHVGEKGEAILYGQNVPLIYWLVHMPFSIIF